MTLETFLQEKASAQLTTLINVFLGNTLILMLYDSEINEFISKHYVASSFLYSTIKGIDDSCTTAIDVYL